jgi:deoxyuridine 5''-triphosphate nucleotidohydrolase (dut)
MRYFSKLNDSVELPARATKGSAGYDIRVTEGGIVPPGKTVVFSTGLTVTMEPDEVLLIYPRSSIGIKRHLMLSNTTGVIDSDYTEEIHMALTNFGERTQIINSSERVAQGIFTKYLVATDDNTTDERTGGIGSTGR